MESKLNLPCRSLKCWRGVKGQILLAGRANIFGQQTKHNKDIFLKDSSLFRNTLNWYK